jgi:CTP:phosphocholine cytidylyltransferase-like protein
MCGGNYPKWETPKQLSIINGEVIVERTIRLLRENGITDIAISTNNKAFDYLDVEILRNEKNNFNQFSNDENKKSSSSWLNAYYPINEEVCYLHGDVYFSDDAIKTIVDTKVKDTMFFCVPDKQDILYKDSRNEKGREPLAYKVVDYKKFRSAIDDLLKMIDDGKFENAKCKPIAWNVYRYLNGLDIGMNAQSYGDINNIFRTRGKYKIINDYTTDIDKKEDIQKIENSIKLGGDKMIKVEVTKEFTLEKFGELKNIQRKNLKTEGHLYVGDVFECNEKMCKYLTGDNPYKKTFVKVIEVIPEKKKEEKIEDAIEGKIEFTEKELKPKAVIKKSKKKKK